jgi:hypothetical protein
MCCGRCYATEPRLRVALRLDIFIEILLGTSVNKAHDALVIHWQFIAACFSCQENERTTPQR